MKDEQAGEAIAKADENDEAAAAVEEEAEPEDNSKSYAAYLEEQAAKKLAELGIKEARKPNEGSKPDKKWEAAKEFKRTEEEDFIAAGEGKAKREKQRKEKQYVEVDMSFKETPRPPREGGRGGARGGRGDGPRGGRGGPRGGRGDGPRGGRGGPRGGAPRGGARGGAAAPAVVINEESFPSLGSA